MNEGPPFCAGIFVGGVLLSVIWVFLVFPGVIARGLDENNHRWTKEAIEHGSGEYNSLTGKFQWIETMPAPEAAPIPMENN